MRSSVQDRNHETYVDRVNRAIDHVVAHLDQPLDLQRVAAVAGFSPFHFHRVFRSILGESLADFTRRLRLERALTLIWREPGQTLTEVAFRAGFSSSSDFSRSFKKRYGVSPSRFDLGAFRARNRALVEQVTRDLTRGHRVTETRAPAGDESFAVTLRTLPARDVAYLRVLEPFRDGAVEAAAARLVAWADQRSLGDGAWLGYMWEDPEIVPLADCRYDVAVVVDRPCAGGEIGHWHFPEMRVAEIEIRGGLDLELRALTWLFNSWLPHSGYVPDDQPCFESWIGRPYAHGSQYFELRAQLPVRR